MKFRAYNLKGYNTFISPLQSNSGDLIQCLNVDPYPQGGKTKRDGYTTMLGTADGSAVKNLFDFTLPDGTTTYLYRYSGSVLYSSLQGTGAWTVCQNGTMAAGVAIGHTIMNHTLLVGDGVGSTRHSTDGTSFTDTTLAPIGNYFTNYQGRVYIGGTSTTLFWSTLGDGTNWSSAGTSDSSSVDIPGAGKINSVFKVADRVITTKTSGEMFRWDGYTLIDMTTQLGPSSAQSIADVEDYRFFLNRVGFFGFGGDKVQLISNPIQRLVYNSAGSAIVGSTFDSAPGGIFKYDYYCAIGTTTDDFTGVTIADAVAKYDYQANEWGFYKYNNFPTAFHHYKDINGVDQFIFGDGAGQVYVVGGNNDNGQPIESAIEFVIHAGAPESYKEWKACDFIFNPGNEAKVQIAASDTFTKSRKNYTDLGDCSDGVAYFRPSSGLRSRFLFVRISDASVVSKFTFYGYTATFNILEK